MEQKQLDELEDSYFGDEFIDDSAAEELVEDITVEDVRPKKASGKMAVKTESKKAKKIEASKTVKKGKSLSEHKHEAKSEPKEEKTSPIESKTVERSSPATEVRPPVDPWKDSIEEENKGSSTWKAITGIAIILLILSVFTQGFRFSEDSGTELSLPDATELALSYVNTNLLRSPFLAVVEDSAEEGNLYRITLSVAGESIDSYITKDGKLFFPQGFETEKPLTELEDSEVAENEVADLEEPEGIPLEDEVDAPTKLEDDVREDTDANLGGSPSEAAVDSDASVSDVEVLAEPAVEDVVIIPLNAKKWMFQPETISVRKGSTVQLKITPFGFDFTFALPGFGITKQIIGPTDVEFKADRAGRFEYKCSSCEDWRGMRGVLEVK